MADLGNATAGDLYDAGQDRTTARAQMFDNRWLGFDPQLATWGQPIVPPCPDPPNAWEGGVLP